MEDDRYYTALAAAWVRGAHPALVRDSDASTVAAAVEAGVRVHRFKRAGVLPRVQRVLGLLKGFAPRTLLDVGSGRGAFLWPLLETLPELEVTAIDVLPHRVADIAAIAQGGVGRITARALDVAALDEDEAYDVVTILEVLEHLPDPTRAVTTLLRAARTAVIATVPSKEDDNPEHIHLFDRSRLQALFIAAGARRVQIDHVLNHIVVVVHK